MRGRIVAHLLQDVLDMPGVFEDLDAGGRDLLAACLQPCPVLPGHNLCRPGQLATCIWLLQTGAACVLQCPAMCLQPCPVLPGHNLCQPGQLATCIWLLQTGTACCQCVLV